MQKTIDQLKDELHEASRDLEQVKSEADSYSKLTAALMDRHYKTLNRIIICLIALNVICLCIIGYFAYVFTTTTLIEETYDQEGTYNLIDSEGNMINSDYPLEVEDGQAEENR